MPALTAAWLDADLSLTIHGAAPAHPIVHVRSRAVVRLADLDVSDPPTFDMQGRTVASALDPALLRALAARPDFEALVLVEVIDRDVAGPRFLELAVVRAPSGGPSSFRVHAAIEKDGAVP